ncbi:MAG: iron ABC transporter permease [Thermoanaerobaculia bacterium]
MTGTASLAPAIVDSGLATHLVRRSRRRRGVLALLGIALLVAVLAGVGLGAVAISPAQVVAISAAHLGFDLGVPFEARQEGVLIGIRLPRVLLGIAVGAALAAAGALLQGLFRNPLVEPGLLGLTAGGSLGASTAIVVGGMLGLSFHGLIGTLLVPVAAFAGALAAGALVARLARSLDRTGTVLLLLTGISVNAFAFAGTGLLTFLATDVQLRTLAFWNLGSLAGATWREVSIGGPLLAAAAFAALRAAHALNLLALGEREAGHLGVDTERLKRRVLIVSAFAAGTATAVAGTIGFVGLVVPQLVRMAAGPDFRLVIPASLIGGSLLVVVADLVARTVVVPAELPLGLVTALIGAPFFLSLVLNERRRFVA